MLVKAGEDRVDLKGFDLLHSASVQRPDGTNMVLLVVPPSAWLRMRGDQDKAVARGIPQYLTYIGPESGHRLWPAPDKEMEVTFTYWPWPITV